MAWTMSCGALLASRRATESTARMSTPLAQDPTVREHCTQCRGPERAGDFPPVFGGVVAAQPERINTLAAKGDTRRGCPPRLTPREPRSTVERRVHGRGVGGPVPGAGQVGRVAGPTCISAGVA